MTGPSGPGCSGSRETCLSTPTGPHGRGQSRCRRWRNTDAENDSGLDQVLDRQLVSAALRHLSLAHQAVLVETFYHGDSLVAVARQLGIPPGTARSRLHYALHALRQRLHEQEAIA